MADFERLGVCPEIIQAIEEDGWLLPTPVQDEAIPLILGGGDVCVAAETGSGKTGAFGLPCLQIVHETLRNKAVTSGGGKSSKNVDFKLDVNDKDPYVQISPDRLECSSQHDKVWNGVRASVDILKGKYMFEVEVLSNALTRVGWSLSVASREIGKDDMSFGYGGTGKKSWNGRFDDYGERFGNGDIIGCLLDRDSQTISFAKNGEELGVAFMLPPNLHASPLKPTLCGKAFYARYIPTSLVYPIEGYRCVGEVQATDSSAGLSYGLEISGRGLRHPLLVILEPTRELATQTYECMVHFGKYLEAPTLRIGLFVGGIDEKAQRDALSQGVDISVGTLQKTMMFVRRRDLDVSNVRFLVLDEADDLMKNDDRGDIQQLKRQASYSHGSRIQTLFFSATLHSPEVRLAIEKVTSRPVWVDLKGRPSIPENVHFVCYKVDPTKILPFPLPNPDVTPPTDEIHKNDPNHGPEGHSQRTKLYKPQIAVAIANMFGMTSCLVFCRTNLDCDNFEKYLISLGGGRGFGGKVETGKENPYSCVVLAGMRSQDERRNNLEHFKSGDVRFLICTDVAARGIDIKELPFLIMLTLPDDPDQFFHRVGRVGRSDKMGLAISIVASQKEKVWYHKCASRGKGCVNTKLIDQGGCCIWYDEPSYLKSIEEKVGFPIPTMDPLTFSVKGIINTMGAADGAAKEKETQGRRAKQKANLLALATSSGKGGGGDKAAEGPKAALTGAMMVYGKAKDAAGDKTTLKHIKDLLPSVEELQSLESNLQIAYVGLLSRGVASTK